MIILVSGKLGSGKDTVADIIEKYSKNTGWERQRFADEIKKSVARWLGVSIETLEDREFKEKILPEEWWFWVYKGEKFDYLSSDFGYFKTTVGAELVKLTPRRIMQLLGTEAGRMIIHPNLWVNAVFSGYEKKALKWNSDGETTLSGYPKWIIPDTRFPNEFHGGRRTAQKHEVPFLTLRVERTLEKRTEGKFKTLEEVKEKDSKLYQKLTHPSETSLDNYLDDFHYVIDNNGTLKELDGIVRSIIKKEGFYE